MVDIQISEANWKLIFPWSNLEKVDGKDKNAMRMYNEQFRENLARITYKVTAESGRHKIVLPGLECTLNMFLHADNSDSVYLEFEEENVGAVDLKCEGNVIRIGNNQKITLSEHTTNVFILIPNYYDAEMKYNGLALYEMKRKRYIYAKGATHYQQKHSNLIHATEYYAYYFLSEEGGETGIIWALSIQSREIVKSFKKVKNCQPHGSGLIFTTTDGIIYSMTNDVQTHKISAHIVGFTGDLFLSSNGSDTLTALNNMKAQLRNSDDSSTSSTTSSSDNFKTPGTPATDGSSRTPSVSNTSSDSTSNELETIPIVHLYLSYDMPTSTNANILYLPEKDAFVLLNVKYGAVKTNFLKFFEHGRKAYFHSITDRQIISVDALTAEQLSKQIRIDQKENAPKVFCNAPYKVVFPDVKNVSVAEAGLRIKFDDGVQCYYQEKAGKYPTYECIVEKMQLDNSALFTGLHNTHDLEVLLQNTLKIIQSDFIEITYFEDLIGFYDSMNKRLLCIPHLQNKNPNINITLLGADDRYAYYIYDRAYIYRAHHISGLCGIESAELVMHGDVIELFDHIIFFKGHGCLDNLHFLSKMPEIKLICIESPVCSLKFFQFENIVISTIDLSKRSDILYDIRILLETLNGYYVERQNDDLCLCNVSAQSSLIFKHAFKSEIRLKVLDDIQIRLNDITNPAASQFIFLSDIVEIYKRINPPIYDINNAYYGRADLKTFSFGERSIKRLLWPSLDDTGIDYVLALLFSETEKEKYIALLKNLSDEFIENIFRENDLVLNVLCFAVKANYLPLAIAVFDMFKNIPKILQKLLFQGNSALYFAVIDENDIMFNVLRDRTRTILGEEVYEKLVKQLL